MAQLLDGSATTTAHTRAESQNCEESVATLTRRHGVNPKTLARWCDRRGVKDLPIGPRERRSTALSPLEEAAIVAFRVQTRLPLFDVFCALKPPIPLPSPAPLCIAASSDMASRDCPRPARGSRNRFNGYERSATST